MKKKGEILSFMYPVMMPNGKEYRYIFSSNYDYEADQATGKLAVSVKMEDEDTVFAYINPENIIASVVVLVKNFNSNDIFDYDEYLKGQ